MNHGPNMIDPPWQARMLEVLDTVEADCEGDAGLVLTGQGKFFSNGLNVEVIMGLEGEDRVRFGASMSQIIGRLLLLPVPTVAAINGHAFAAGAFLALACDYRLMREDRGWICVSEVDAGVPIGEPMMNLLKAKVPPETARDAVLTGKRYGADDAIAAGLADGKASEIGLLGEARKLAENLASKERRIFKTLKRQLHADVGAGFGLEA
ncbi:MAG: enoyl-CoA hydratase [Deltaproteobacteria bacterium]|nr:enoyl-CoA hydratase [Deltaproteobacteria bacterium]